MSSPNINPSIGNSLINPSFGNRLMPSDQVANLSPSLYSAASNSNLNAAQMNQVNQIAGTVALNKQLLSMDKKAAQNKWGTLDPATQEQVKAMYGTASYIPTANQNIFIRAAKNLGNTALGPFKTAFKVAANYNQLINTPYLAIREITQGANPFDWNVYRKAYDGTMIYDQGSLQKLHQQYGDTDTFVAMKTLQGLKPGAIIDAYGKVNSDIITSITKMINDPQNFSMMLNSFKAAQVSVGRDIARVMYHTQPGDNKLYSSSKWNKTSGLLDAITQVVIDPLTWLSGGTAAIAEKETRLAGVLGEKLGAKAGSAISTAFGQRSAYLANILAKDPSEATVARIFQRPEIQRTWNEVAGPLIKKYTEAIKAKDYQGAAIARRDLGRQIPDLNNDGMVELLSRGEVFDAKSAQNLFSHSEPMTKLLAGNVDGTDYFRNGVPIARRTRMITSGMNKVLGDLFNGSLEKSALDKVGPDFIKDLEKVGLENDASSNLSSEVLNKATDELSGVKRRLGRFAARNPGSSAIDITDAGVDRTLGTVRDLARTIYPKSHSEFFAQAFKDSSESDRVILLRGLYMQIMYNMGLHATSGGKDLMEQILRDKFGNAVNYSTRKEIDIAPELEGSLRSRGTLIKDEGDNMGGLYKASLEGPIHPYQGSKYIGNLPWHGKPGEASLADYAFNFNKDRHVREFINAAGGATRSNFTRQMVDSWSSATLFPRLGIRSAIDEAFFALMGQPGRDLVRYAQGRKLAKMVAAFTGSDELIPPVKRALLNKIGKNPAKFIADHSTYDGTEKLMQGRLDKTMINGEEAHRIATREDLAAQTIRIFDSIIPPHLHDYMYQAMVHHPDITKAISNSIIGKSGLNENLAGGDLASQIISGSNLSQAYKDNNITPGGKNREYSIEELNRISEVLPALAHYQNFFMKFTKNKANFTGKPQDFFNPAVTFMRHNALRTGKDLEAATNELLRKIGVNPEDMTISNPTALKRYLDFSHQNIKDVGQGLSPVESAVKRIEFSLLDLRDTFHGGVVHNPRLTGWIKELASDIQSESQYMPDKAMSAALDSVDFEKFQDLTQGYRPKGMINADVNLAKDATNESRFQAMDRWNGLQHNAMEWMDAQNNHMFRQPALWLTYAKMRERYAPVEKKFIQEQVAQGVPQDIAQHNAEKRFTEIAMDHAAQTVLTYVDNPRVKSNLAWTLRTTGRFYRATEDFYRRVFRLRNVTPQVMYRLRLANVGFQSNGFIHPDANGDPYLVMPGDNIMFHAANMFTNAISGNNPLGPTVKQPLYNDFAFKLSMGNPSFQQDAGQPSLSGPFVALPVVSIKYALGWFGGGWGKQAASGIDKLVLGPVNQNLTLQKALVPASLQRIWNMIPKGEQDQQTVSAAMQAVAYNAANGITYGKQPGPNTPADEYNIAKKEYLDKIKVSVHNILFLRSFLGMMSPIAPNLIESKGLPSYLKNVGIQGLRPEFSDLLQGIMRNAKGQIQDPYEAALMAYTGKYPGKLIYTVARDASSNIMVQKTQQTQQWMQQHGDKINTYGDAALIFAPNVGNFDPNTYTWMQAAGLINQKKLGDYLDDVTNAIDKQTYFDLRGLERQAMTNPALDAEQRQSYLNQVSATIQGMKDRNPYLEAELNKQGFGIGKQENMLVGLKGILNDPSFPMTPQVRNKMGAAVSIVNAALDQIASIGTDQDVADGGAQKQDIKNKAIQAIRELGGAQGRNAPEDLQIQEALRAIFTPILDNKARTTLKAVG